VIELRGEQWVVAGGGPSDERLLGELPAFVSGWHPGDGGPGRALLAVAARLGGLLADRLGRAPDKAKLALLDALGVVPLPAQPARCPVVFEMLPGAGHGQAPAGTRLGAQAGGSTLEFETESQIALAASRLMEVKAALPGDQYADYTQDALGGRPFTLFDHVGPVRRQLYLGHSQLFALTPGALLQVQVELAPESGPLVGELVWEYWDGTGWVGFAPWLPEPDPTQSPDPSGKQPDPDLYSSDGTQNLRRSGTVRLRAGQATAAPNKIRGINTCWVRARLKPPDPGDDPANLPDPERPVIEAGRSPPQIDTLRASLFQTVGGFRVFSRKENVIDAKGRKVRVRLVDDSGSPLKSADPPADPTQDPSTYHYYYSVATREIPVQKFTYDEKTGYFNLSLAGEETLTLRIAGEPPPPGHSVPTGQRVWDLPPIEGLSPGRSYDIDLARAGRLPELAFGNGIALDLSKTFLPFGPQPLPGTTFLFTCAEVANKPGARVQVFTEVSGLSANDPAPPPDVRWEYWNGLVWAPLPDLDAGPDSDRARKVLSFLESGEIYFTVPANLAVKTEFGQDKPWMRAQLASGGYLVHEGGQVTIPDPKDPRNPDKAQVLKFDKVFPPQVQKFRLEYEYTSPAEPPQACLSFNDFRWDDVTDQVAFGGDPFTAFGYSTDVRPALYLGFSRTLPADLVSLFFDVSASRPEPELTWEYWDGGGWQALALGRDETRGLYTAGLVQFLWPGTSLADPEPVASALGATVSLLDLQSAARFRPDEDVAVSQDDDAELARVKEVDGTDMALTAPLEKKFTAPLIGPAPLARFGTPRHWVRVVWPRAEYPQPPDPGVVTVNGIYLNAVWARQTRTQDKELLGTTTGVDGEVFNFSQTPVLPGEVVEVLELDGALARAEWPVLQKELQAAGMAAALDLERDPKTNEVVRAWVRWEGRPNFAGSGPHDRHYVIERVSGRLQFGDNRAGMVPPAPANVRASYQAGGGRPGNLPARAVRVVLGSVPGAQQVFNPVKASGGADGELARGADPTPILDRGPQLVRHRDRAVSALDYEQLALAASPGVALARAVTPADSACVVPAGSVRVLIAPYADESEPEPAPTQALCDLVRDYLAARDPAVVGGRVEVSGPDYFQVGVEAVLVPRDPAAPGLLVPLAKQAIARFLHPVLGGPAGRGWQFGPSAVHRSDVVARLHRDLGDQLAYIEDLRLLDGGVPAAEQVDVPPGRLPSAGPIQVLLSTGEVCP
jgi:hypothetical protein